MKKAIIFDCDGTLMDTMEFNFKAWKYALNLHNYDIEEKKYYFEEGKTPYSIVRGYTSNEELVKSIVELKEDYFLKNSQIKLVKGAKECLDLVFSKKILIAMVTGGANRRISKLIDELNLRDYFDVVITADDVSTGKPDAEPYLKALAMLNVKAEECYVIENAPSGIDSAKNANIECIALETTLSKEYLIKADKVFKNYDELNKFLLSMLS